jgi:diguanylate cyclase (GGDEF)-like protein
VDALVFVLNLYALYDIYYKKRLNRASIIATMNAFFLLLAIAYYGKADNFTLVWVIFFPVFAIFINGYKKGLIISIVFYIIAFYIVYEGIDKWLNGYWDASSFIRFAAANLGMLFITYFFERNFDAAHRELIKNRNIEKKYIEVLREASIRDPLTKLYNRRHLDYLFHQQFLKAETSQSYFAFFILDLDNFKTYNDMYGHVEGDKALEKVSNVLRNAMTRSADSVFRVGGEEFAGLLMADSKKKIFQTVESVRAGVESLSLKHKASAVGILTASIGLCIIHNFEIENFEQMYKIADDALYEAKDKGRNCIIGDNIISTL